MKIRLLKIWNTLALVLTRLLRGIAILLVLVEVSDWPFYALNARPFFDFGWGGLLLLLLAYMLADLKSLALAIHDHYIGPYQEQHRHDEQEIIRLKANLEATQDQNGQLLRRVAELEAQVRTQAANAALNRLKPVNESFGEEL